MNLSELGLFDEWDNDGGGDLKKKIIEESTRTGSGRRGEFGGFQFEDVETVTEGTKKRKKTRKIKKPKVLSERDMKKEYDIKKLTLFKDWEDLSAFVINAERNQGKVQNVETKAKVNDYSIESLQKQIAHQKRIIELEKKELERAKLVTFD